MRVLILALSVLGILVGADAAKAGPSTANRDLAVSVDPVTFTDEATQQTEDQIGLDKAKRRDVQHRLTRLGFDTKGSGKFDESTRAVIDTPQYKALLAESVPVAYASSGRSGNSDDDHPARHRGGGGAHHSRSGGPVGVIGGMVGGLFGRR
jgi:hypothetical protein